MQRTIHHSQTLPSFPLEDLFTTPTNSDWKNLDRSLASTSHTTLHFYYTFTIPHTIPSDCVQDYSRDTPKAVPALLSFCIGGHRDSKLYANFLALLYSMTRAGRQNYRHISFFRNV